MTSPRNGDAPPADVVSTHTVRNLLQLVTDFVGRPVWQNAASPDRACERAITAARRVGAVAAAWAPASSGPHGLVWVQPLIERVVADALAGVAGALEDALTGVYSVVVDDTLLSEIAPATRLAVLVSELTANAAAHRAPHATASVVVRVEWLDGGGIVAHVSNDAATPVPVGSFDALTSFDDGGLGIALMIAESWQGGLHFDCGTVTVVSARLPGFPALGPNILL